jgi:hypothetical protein
LYKDGAGKMCSNCYKLREGIRTAPAPPVPSAPARSHKRKQPAAPAAPAAPAVTLAPPPSLLSLFDLPVFNTHGWALRASTRSTRGTAASWLELAQSDELKQWEVKRGGFWQHDTHPSLACSLLDEKRVRLLQSSERHARQLLHELGVDSSHTALQLAAAKLLRTNPGEGQQEVHYDITEYKRAARCFTVLLYLTPTLSTQLPRLSLAETSCCFTEGETLPPASARAVLTRDKFVAKRVDAGSMLALRCITAHWGEANPDDGQRYVLFMLFSPSTSRKPDTEEQRYPHGVVR